MNPERTVLDRTVLAYNGHPSSCAALHWLASSNAADVVAVIVDIGQGEDPEETYNRAISSGALRAHVIDRREEFARLAVTLAASLDAGPDEPTLRRLTYPVIASALVEVAVIEGAFLIAHGSEDEALDAEIHALTSALRRVIAPAREWRDQRIDVGEYMKAHRLTPAVAHPDRHLLIRSRVAAATSPADTAVLSIEFDAGTPVSVNGVPMTLPELIESLSLIGGRYRGQQSNDTPALTLLQNAYRECAGHGLVTLRLQPGSLAVLNPAEAQAYLVHHA